MATNEERIAEQGATLDATKAEVRDAWQAIHRTAENVERLGNRVERLVTLSEQPHRRAQCICIDHIESLDTRVATIEHAADRAQGGGAVVLWLLGGGFLSILAVLGILIASLKHLPK